MLRSHYLYRLIWTLKDLRHSRWVCLLKGVRLDLHNWWQRFGTAPVVGQPDTLEKDRHAKQVSGETTDKQGRIKRRLDEIYCYFERSQRTSRDLYYCIIISLLRSSVSYCAVFLSCTIIFNISTYSFITGTSAESSLID